MASPLRYGPRFGSSAVGVGYHYDPSLDIKDPGWLIHARMHQTPEKKAFNAAKTSARLRAASARKPKQSSEYADAQNRLLDTVHAALKALNFGLAEVNDAVRFGGPTFVQRKIIMEATDKLRKALGDRHRHIPDDARGGE